MSDTTPVEEHHERQPILHSPYDEPDRHWALVDHQTTGEITPFRRPAEQPVPMGALRHQQLRLDDGAAETSNAASMIDVLRAEVRAWRERHWNDATENTRRLLEYWSRPPGEGAFHSPFYAQREAVETVVYLTEIADANHACVQRLKQLGNDWSRGLTRLAIRMATGTGKTTVMAMLIAWYAVNRRAEHRHASHRLARNIGRIVVIAPGRTISSQLRRRLDPRHADNLYDAGSLLPLDLRPRLNNVVVTVLNYEKLQPRQAIGLATVEIGGRRTEAIDWARADEASHTPETYSEMWDRLLHRPIDRHGDRIVVINDEAHHCWERKTGVRTTRRDGNDKGVWMEAIHALNDHPRYRVAQTIDLTATPIFIDPPNAHTPLGQPVDRANPLVPWIISEFALTESMEAGLVTIPMPPRQTDAAPPGALQNLYEYNNGRDLDTVDQRKKVLNAARLLYSDYEATFREWAEQARRDRSIGHPVLIVIVNSKKNARGMLDMLGGRRRERADAYDPPRGFDLLSNVPHPGATKRECSEQPARTILVYSSDKGAIEKSEGSRFDHGAIGVEEVKNSRQLEEILATVAEPGRAGQHVRCVISVGMLTEGWDCQRVTHILGYRKFGSQLLCEQTMGRALRRHDYENRIEARRRDNRQVTERFEATYATVLGVPFDRYGIKGVRNGPIVVKPRTEVRVVDERRGSHRIRVPDLRDYALVHTTPTIRLDPDRVTTAHLLRRGVNIEITWAQCRGPFGKTHVIKVAPTGRPDTGIWKLASDLATKLADDCKDREDASYRSSRLFASCLRTVKAWLAHDKVHCERTDVLLDDDSRQEALHQILHAILDDEDAPIQKVGRPSDPRRPCRSAGAWRPFSTTLTNIVQLNNSELNVAACHNRFETHIARALDEHSRIAAFIRNHGPERFEIPYKSGGKWARFVPDFIARAEPVEIPHADRTTSTVVPHLVVEGKGPLDDKAADKGHWTADWWVPAANHAIRADGGPEARWVYLEVRTLDGIDTQIDHAIERAARTP